MGSIQNLTAGTTVADRADVATRILQRMIGLLSRSGLEEGEALIFPRCNAIHTCFMRFAIDVLFIRTAPGSGLRAPGTSPEPRALSPEPIVGTVVRTAEWVKPGRLLRARGADTVIELPAGSVTRTGTQPGHHIAFFYSTR